MKKIVSTLVAALLAVSCLAGCGTEGQQGSAGENSSAKSGTVKIGGIGPLTGSAASYGISVQNGGQLAVDEINAAGGMMGCRLNTCLKMTRTIPRKQSTHITV